MHQIEFTTVHSYGSVAQPTSRTTRLDHIAKALMSVNLPLLSLPRFRGSRCGNIESFWTDDFFDWAFPATLEHGENCCPHRREVRQSSKFKNFSGR